MATVTHPPRKGYRTLRLPLSECEYDRFLSDRAYAKARLDELYEDFPELCPEAFPWGYTLYGFTDPSIKQEICCRRIRLEQGQVVFTIAPAFVMPYISCSRGCDGEARIFCIGHKTAHFLGKRKLRQARHSETSQPRLNEPTSLWGHWPEKGRMWQRMPSECIP